MSVLAKMSCNGSKAGVIGHTVYLSPVWEGSSELQKISENSAFGDATPGGDAFFEGRGLELFQPTEEYYIHLYGVGETLTHGRNLILAKVDKHYRSETDTNNPGAGVQFRLAGLTMDSARVNLGLYIKNQHAIDYLDRFDAFDVVITKARGRRSGAEIAIRQKLVDDHVASTPWAHAPEAWERHGELLRRKLARAQGEDV